MNIQHNLAKLILTTSILLISSLIVYGSDDKNAADEKIDNLPFCTYGTDEKVYEVYMEDILYAVKGRDSLYLTRYFYNPELNNPNITGKKQPVIMFLFGGGFMEGNRNFKPYLKYFVYYVKQGYQVITIDYRQGLRNWYANYFKEVKSGKKVEVKEQEIQSVLLNAVDLAVADCITATNFVISQSDKWHTDNNRIILSGSSSGAITAMQTEYFEEEDFDAFLTRLQTFEITYLHPVKEHSWGQRVVRFYDPDGHIIEVGETMKTVCRRFLDAGMTPEQTAERMDVPLKFVRACMR